MKIVIYLLTSMMAVAGEIGLRVPYPRKAVLWTYPQVSALASDEGTVRIHVLIGRDGKVMTTSFIDGNKRLAEFSREMLSRWIFHPAKGLHEYDFTIEFKIINEGIGYAEYQYPCNILIVGRALHLKK